MKTNKQDDQSKTTRDFIWTSGRSSGIRGYRDKTKKELFRDRKFERQFSRYLLIIMLIIFSLVSFSR